MIRITPKDAKGMMDAYAKVYAPPEEKKETEAKADSAETPAPTDAEQSDKSTHMKEKNV